MKSVRWPSGQSARLTLGRLRVRIRDRAKQEGVKMELAVSPKEAQEECKEDMSRVGHGIECLTKIRATLVGNKNKSVLFVKLCCIGILELF